MTSPKPALPRMSSPHYEPKVGDTITVSLPDEITRAVVEKVISDEAVIARLSTFTTAKGKSHNYTKGDMVPCRFEKLGMGVPGWRAVTQRELDDADAAQKKRKKRKKGK